MTDGADELQALRDELVSCKATSDRLRNQLSDAKARAKEVIQRQRREAEQRTSALEDDLRMRSDELDQVKSLLRLADDEKVMLTKEAALLKTEIRTLTESVKRAESDRDEKEQAANSAEKTVQQLVLERDRLNNDLANVRKELQKAKVDTPAEQQVALPVSTATSESGDAGQTTTEVSADNADDKNNNESEATKDDSKLQTQNSEQLTQAQEHAANLSKQLEKLKAEMAASKDAHEKSLADSKTEKAELIESLSKAEATVADLKSTVEQRDTTLREERARRTAIDAGAKEEADKVLAAKIAEMERLVAGKQAEIGRVREKARTYLKELNAEKRDMEEKNKKEVGALEKKIDEERDKVSAAEARADGAAKEIDSCLAVIRDKQKNIQMLTMTVSTLKTKAADSEQQVEALREEFSRYKERARLALEERQSSPEKPVADIESATANLRAELERAQKSANELRKQAQRARELEGIIEEMRERAERAEAAADLLRSDASGVSSANINRVDRLEERIAGLESELATANSNVDNAELRHATTKMRLEAADKALRVAEVRATETETALNKQIQALRVEAQKLHEELDRAKHSAECAQRTAAAAAKALTFSAADPHDRQSTDQERRRGSETRTSIDDGQVFMNGRASGNQTPREEDASFDVKIRTTRGRMSSFERAMEEESGRLGLSPRHSSDSRRLSLDTRETEASLEDIKTRDQQIVVLTAQVAELGMLLDDVRQESQLRAEQTALLKEEVKNLDAKLAAAEKLNNGAPFSYLRTIVVRYLETEDVTLLPVICNVLSFSDDEKERVRALRGAKPGNPSSKGSGYFSLPFLGS